MQLSYLKTISKNKPPKNKVYIYSLSDKYGNIYYIGKTTQSLYMRYCDHVNITNSRKNINTKSKNWIKKLLKNIELIDMVNNDVWEENEIFYINYFKYLGFDLKNHQLGGGLGNSGMNWFISDDLILKKRKKLSENRYSPIIVYSTKGEIIFEFKNLIEASLKLNIPYSILHNYKKTKTLLNKKYIIMDYNKKFNINILNRKIRKIKINNKNIFNNQKECAKFLNISTSYLSQIINEKVKSPFNFKIEKI